MPDPEHVQQAQPAPESDGAPAPSSDPTPPQPKTFISRLLQASKNADENELKNCLAEEANELAAKHGVSEYKIVVLFDDVNSISDFHSDQIYSDLSGVKNSQDILLLLYSRGGKVEPAYLISKTCKKLAKNKFVVAVPRRAKSAATLLSLGADEIHLGLMSQLGPIDLQVGDLPALGLMTGVTKVAELVCMYPKSADMWAKYLSDHLNLRTLGYLERLGESTAQYAERLLQSKTLPPPWTAETLANHLVNHYKDHSFLIDLDEATSLFGDLIRTGTPEYNFANALYQAFWFSDLVYSSRQQKEISMVGDLTPSSVNFTSAKK